MTYCISQVALLVIQADDMISTKSAVGSPVFPVTGRLWAAIRAVTPRGLQASHPLVRRSQKNSKVSLDGQPVYRTRQVLTDLILTERGRTFGREVWGMSASPGKLTVRECVEVQSQEFLLTWRSWSRKGSCSHVWFKAKWVSCDFIYFSATQHENMRQIRAGTVQI